MPYKQGVSSSSLLAPTSETPSEDLFPTLGNLGESGECSQTYSHKTCHRWNACPKPLSRLTLLRHSYIRVRVGCDRVRGMR